MKASLLAFVVVGFSVLGEASRVRHVQIAEAKRSVNQLFARQSIDPSSIPETCQTQCAAVLNDVTACENTTDMTCLCNTTTENDFIGCVNCMSSEASVPPDLISGAQEQLQQFVQVCQAAGINLPLVSTGSITNPDPDTDTTTTDLTIEPTTTADTIPDDSTPTTSPADASFQTSTPLPVAATTSSLSADPAAGSGDYSAPIQPNGASAMGGNVGVVVVSLFAMVGSLVVL